MIQKLEKNGDDDDTMFEISFENIGSKKKIQSFSGDWIGFNDDDDDDIVSMTFISVDKLCLLFESNVFKL